MIDSRNVLVLVQKELRDARRNRWFVIYTVLFALLSLGLAWLGLSGLGNYRLAGFGRTTAALINLVLLILPLMGFTLGAMALTSERERGTLLYLLAQPVTSLEVLLGKWVGLAGAMLATLVAGFGLTGLILAWRGGMMQASHYLALVGLAFLLALASLAVGLLISTLARRAATAVGVALFLWLALVFLGDLGMMGSSIVLQFRPAELLSVALLNPLQVFKLAAILTIRGSLEVLGPAGLYAVRTYGARLMPILLAILGTWIVLPLCCTFLIVYRRGTL